MHHYSVSHQCNCQCHKCQWREELLKDNMMMLMEDLDLRMDSGVKASPPVQESMDLDLDSDIAIFEPSGFLEGVDDDVDVDLCNTSCPRHHHHHRHHEEEEEEVEESHRQENDVPEIVTDIYIALNDVQSIFVPLNDIKTTSETTSPSSPLPSSTETKTEWRRKPRRRERTSRMTSPPPQSPRSGPVPSSISFLTQDDSSISTMDINMDMDVSALQEYSQETMFPHKALLSLQRSVPLSLSSAHNDKTMKDDDGSSSSSSSNSNNNNSKKKRKKPELALAA